MNKAQPPRVILTSDQLTDIIEGYEGQEPIEEYSQRMITQYSQHPYIPDLPWSKAGDDWVAEFGESASMTVTPVRGGIYEIGLVMSWEADTAKQGKTVAAVCSALAFVDVDNINNN